MFPVFLLIFLLIFGGKCQNVQIDLNSILEGINFRSDNVSFHFKNLNVQNGKIEFDEMSINGNSIVEEEHQKEITSTPKNEYIFEYPELAEMLDNDIDPCDDFYEHVCHRWIDSNNISDDETSVGHMDLLTQRVHSQIQEILESDYTLDTTEEQKTVHKFYGKCMKHKKSPDNKAYEMLLLQLAKVHGLKKNSTLTDWMIEFRPMNFFVDLSVGINEYNSSLRVLQIMPSHPTLSHNAYSKREYRHEYLAMRQFLGQLLDLIQADDVDGKVFGGKAEEYEARIEAFFEVDKQLAQIAYFDQYNKTTTMSTFSDLNSLFTSLEWDRYFSSFKDSKLLDLLKTIEIQIIDEEGLMRIDKMLKTINQTTLEYYLDWEAIMYFGEFFDYRYQEVMQGYNVAVSGAKTQSKEKDCMSTTSTIFYDLVAQIYVQKYFPTSTRQEVTEMVTNIVESFENMLINNTWMDKSTKSAALEKLHSMKKFIGLNDQIFNTTWIAKKYEKLSLEENDTYYTSMLKIQQWTQNVILSRLNTTRSIQEFEFPSTDVNAFYDPTSNSIALTAAILQSPYFNLSLPSSINYGAIGIAIGHEITHGFDISGADYDKLGNRKNWWDTTTMKTFMNLSKCFIDQYSNITVDTTNLTIDGRLTLNENIADNGGIRAAIQAFKKLPPPTNLEKIRGLETKSPLQLFFISNAYVWCSKIRPQQILSRLYSDVHSPEKWRINTVFSNQPEFAEAFQCKLGSNMNPVKKCKVW